jgi:hypothetical protein
MRCSRVPARRVAPSPEAAPSSMTPRRRRRRSGEVRLRPRRCRACMACDVAWRGAGFGEWERLLAQGAGAGGEAVGEVNADEGYWLTRTAVTAPPALPIRTPQDRDIASKVHFQQLRVLTMANNQIEQLPPYFGGVRDVALLLCAACLTPHVVSCRCSWRCVSCRDLLRVCSSAPCWSLTCLATT